jgi:molybdopterin/thiamine biosynthesis adenylyltransferase
MTKLLVLFTSILAYFIQPVSVKDFEPAFGKWTGTLTYLDYTSGKPYTMPASMNISVDKSNTQQLVFSIEYPNEPKANGNDTLVISADGTLLDGASVVSKKKVKEVLQIITEKEGVDGNENKKALLRHVYTIGKKEFSNRKEVKFQGEEKWVMRNEYKMTR